MNWDEDKAPSFKFGFQLGATDADSEVVADTVAAQTPAVPELAGEELTPDEVQQAVDAADGVCEAVRIGPDLLMLKHRPRNARDVLGDEGIEDSDLKPGVYEGGLKLWECAIDLIRYLREEAVSLQGVRVLELGCGHGLPGVYAATQGASEVTLQDYNREVLVELTIPNATANLQRDGKSTDAQPSGSCRLRYLAGDWARLHEHVEAHAYEVILTSDTVYSVANLPKLYRLIKHALKPRGGYALVAAKSYYFGVGGGTRQFEEIVRADGCMQVEQARNYADGASNVRELLRLSYPNVPT